MAMVNLYDRSVHLRVFDGQERIQLCVARIGAAKPNASRRILCLHGNPSQLDHWSETVSHFASLGEVVMYDEPGLGRSAGLIHGSPSLERSARVATSVLDALDWDSGVDLIGHSHGGMVALTLAALAPQRISRLVLLATGGTPAHLAHRMLALPGAGPALAGIWSVISRTMPVSFLRALVEFSSRALFAPDAMPLRFVDDELHSLMMRPDLLLAMARLAADDPCSKVASHAAQVVAPVLVLHGLEDGLVPIANVRRLFDILRSASPSSRFVELPGGHLMHLSRPGTVASEVEAWLA